MTINEKALTEAAKVYNASLGGGEFGATRRVIEAYLSALPPATVVMPAPSPEAIAKIEEFIAQQMARTLIIDVVSDFIALMDTILDEDGATVAFTGANPDFNGMPNHCVTVCASWTDWQERAFRADTREQCLRDAVAFKKTHEEQSQ